MRLLSEEAATAVDGPITAASQSYSPLSVDYLQNPYAHLAKFRETEPVFFSPELGAWVVTRHETVKQVLRDSERFSAMIVSDPLKPMCPMAKSVIQNSEFDVPPMLVNNDPPSHTRYRKFFSAPLQRPRLLKLEPFIRSTVSQYLDRFEQSERPADLIKALTWDVPALVLFELMGVPKEDVEKVKTWADSRVVLTWGRPTDEEQTRLAKGAVEYYRYAAALVQSKVDNPTDDYLSDLIRLRNGDDNVMSLREITGTAFNLLFAGHETTSGSSASLFLTLLQNRDLWDSICRGETPIAPVVEEGLRYESPVHAWRRKAKEDIVLDGIKVPAGSRLQLVIGAANRDGEVFENPDSFNPERKNLHNHVAFGSGLHLCLGAPLARLEIQIMLELLSQRLPGLRLVDDQDLEYVPNTAMRALRQLMVTW